eukprot:gene21267-32725_t
MQLNVNDAQAIEVSELTFGGEFNETLVHQAVVAYMAGGRQDLLNKLNGMGLTDVLIVSEAVDQNLYLAARNLPHVDVRDVQGSDPVSLIAYDKVLITVSAVKKFEELLG